MTVSDRIWGDLMCEGSRVSRPERPMNRESRGVWLLCVSGRSVTSVKPLSSANTRAESVQKPVSLVNPTYERSSPTHTSVSSCKGTTHQRTKNAYDLRWKAVPLLRYLHHPQLRHLLIMNLPLAWGATTAQHRHNRCQTCSTRPRHAARSTSGLPQ